MNRISQPSKPGLEAQPFPPLGWSAAAPNFMIKTPQTEAEAETMRHAELISTRYQFRSQFVPNVFDPVTFDRMISPSYSGEKWAIRRNGSCLAKDCEWEYEPIPSSRNDEFYQRCRFDSLDDAVDCYQMSRVPKANKSNTASLKPK